MKWFRFYHDAYRNPKVQDMRPELFKFWVNVLCVASESEPRGRIASEGHLRRALGLSGATVKRYCSELEGLVLLHRSDTGALTPHDWSDLQPESDDSAKRQRDKRARACGDKPSEPFPQMSRDTSRDKNVTSCDSRARALLEVEREVEVEESATTPPAVSSLGPEYLPVAKYAEEQGGDVSWALWSDRMGRAGHPARSIRAAIDEAAGNGKLNQGYVATILRRWAVEGEPAHRNGTAPRRSEPVIPFHRKGDPL